MRVTGDRRAGSAIYYLLTDGTFSALHALDAGELWHHYAGDAVEHVQFSAGEASPLVRRLGRDVLSGDVPQVDVPPGAWQGARLAPGWSRGWALLGCTVVPAWEERGFALAGADALIARHPGHAALIRALTR
jgi:uncharacterized protein